MLVNGKHVLSYIFSDSDKSICKLLVKYGANVNFYEEDGDPILAKHIILCNHQIFHTFCNGKIQVDLKLKTHDGRTLF